MSGGRWVPVEDVMRGSSYLSVSLLLELAFER